MIVCNPEIEKGALLYRAAYRHVHIQLWLHAEAERLAITRRAYMIASPDGRVRNPLALVEGFVSETDFAVAIIAHQLFNPADIENVKKAQAGYRAMTLSRFQNKPAHPAAAEINWPKIDKQMAVANPFAYLNFILTLCPPSARFGHRRSRMRERFAKIGVEAGKPLPIVALKARGKGSLRVSRKKWDGGDQGEYQPVSASKKTAGGSRRMALATATPSLGISFVAPPPQRRGSTATTLSGPSIRCW